MNMSSDANRVRLPKEILVFEILKRVQESLIREEFGGQHGTTLENTLKRQSKPRLAAFLFKVSPDSKNALHLLEQEYPLRSAPTLYVLKTVQAPKTETLAQTVDKTYQLGQKAAEDFTERERVWRVFADQASRTLHQAFPLIEITLGYLKRVEYREADENSKNYRRVDV